MNFARDIVIAYSRARFSVKSDFSSFPTQIDGVKKVDVVIICDQILFTVWYSTCESPNLIVNLRYFDLLINCD